MKKNICLNYVIKILIGIFIIVYTPYYFISPLREMIWIYYLIVLYKFK